MQPVQGMQMCPQQVSHLQYCPQMYVVSKPTNRRYANYFITALKSHTHTHTRHNYQPQIMWNPSMMQ